MAPTKKPAPKAKPQAKTALKPAAKAAQKPVVKTAAKPAAKSTMTVWPAETHTHDHDHSTCCGHSHAPQSSGLCCLTSCCPVAKLVFTRNFWAASVVAFFIIFATDWILHARFLMQDYAETSAIWRAEGEIRNSLIFLSQALTAMAYAAIILGLGYAHRWFGSFTSGLLAASPMAIGALAAYTILPLASPYIPTVWAIAGLLQGGLAGLAICAALHVSRAPEEGSCCGSKATMH